MEILRLILFHHPFENQVIKAGKGSENMFVTWWKAELGVPLGIVFWIFCFLFPQGFMQLIRNLRRLENSRLNKN